MTILVRVFDKTTTVRLLKDVCSSHQREIQVMSSINNLLAEQDRAEF